MLEVESRVQASETHVPSDEHAPAMMSIVTHLIFATLDVWYLSSPTPPSIHSTWNALDALLRPGIDSGVSGVPHPSSHRWPRFRQVCHAAEHGIGPHLHETLCTISQLHVTSELGFEKAPSCCRLLGTPLHSFGCNFLISTRIGLKLGSSCSQEQASASHQFPKQTFSDKFALL